jgi:hypothetical protein
VASNAEYVIGVLVSKIGLLHLFSGTRQVPMGEVAASAIEFPLEQRDALGQGLLRDDIDAVPV